MRDRAERMLCVLAMLLFVVMPGCGSESGEADGGPDAADAGQMQAQADDNTQPGAADTPVDGTAVSFTRYNGPNAAHPVAGRSPFPEVGEVVRQPIPAEQLSQEDPFRPEIDPADIPDLVPWQQAGQYLGHEITVEGRIVDVGQTRTGSIFFLNFREEWQGTFYMVVFEDLADTLDGGVQATFLNKLVHVTGEVEDHRGRPQIRILSMDQVRFVDE